MDRCVYCNRKSVNIADFSVELSGESEKHKGCSEKCISKATSYLSYVNRYTKLFWLIMVLALLLAFAGVFFPIPTSLGILLLGVIVIVFPFATPQTVYIFGIMLSKVIVRTIGLVVIAGSLISFVHLALA